MRYFLIGAFTLFLTACGGGGGGGGGSTISTDNQTPTTPTTPSVSTPSGIASTTAFGNSTFGTARFSQ